MSREKDIQELCKQVLNVELLHKENGSYGMEWEECPFCEASDYYSPKIEHENNCGYLIAKDLMTRIK